jgi:hypothetical protein
MQQRHHYTYGTVMTTLGCKGLVIVARNCPAQGVDAFVKGGQTDTAEPGLSDPMQLAEEAMWNVRDGTRECYHVPSTYLGPVQAGSSLSVGSSQ